MTPSPHRHIDRCVPSLPQVCRLVAALGRLQHSQPALMAAVQDHLLYGNNALSYGAEDLVALMHGLARAGAARQWWVRAGLGHQAGS